MRYARLGLCIFDLESGELHKGEILIRLRKKESELLRVLILGRRKEFITLDSLTKSLWGDQFSQDNHYSSFRTTICGLRRKLKAVSNDRIRIIAKYPTGFAVDKDNAYRVHCDDGIQNFDQVKKSMGNTMKLAYLALVLAAGLLGLLYNITAQNQKNKDRTMEVSPPGERTRKGVVVPEIVSVSPSSGKAGDIVLITGADIVKDARFWFGGMPCERPPIYIPNNAATPKIYHGDSDDPKTLTSQATQLQVKVPPHKPGVVDILVMNPDGGTMRLNKAFTYVSK